jgi:hypothetical protein
MTKHTSYTSKYWEITQTMYTATSKDISHKTSQEYNDIKVNDIYKDKVFHDLHYIVIGFEESKKSPPFKYVVFKHLASSKILRCHTVEFLTRYKHVQ